MKHKQPALVRAKIARRRQLVGELVRLEDELIEVGAIRRRTVAHSQRRQYGRQTRAVEALNKCPNGRAEPTEEAA